MSNPLIVEFPLSKDHFRRMRFAENGRDFEILHMYPTLADYAGGIIPDKVNPRSHDENCTKSAVCSEIRDTLIDAPEDMILANRGATILAEKVVFDPDKGRVQITLRNYADRAEAIHGIADGATSEAQIAQVQKALRENLEEVEDKAIPNGLTSAHLFKARFHLQVFCGISNRDDILKLSKGRNRSRAVKAWSLDDWLGKFDTFKNRIETGKFAGKIGYEENSSCKVKILDAIALMTLFHPVYEKKDGGKDSFPTTAYTGKGSMNDLFLNADMQEGYKKLFPLIDDILSLYDHVYMSFGDMNDRIKKARGKESRIGGKVTVMGEKVFPSRKKILNLTGQQAEVIVHDGILYPILASLRCLIDFRGNEAKWKVDPFQFWNEHGVNVVIAAFEYLEDCKNIPNYFGKQKLAYRTCYQTAKMELMEATT